MNELKNGKLPFKYSFKMGVSNLFHKKIKLISTLLLTTLSLICLGLTIRANAFDLNQKHIDTLIKNNEYEVTLNNYNKIIDYEQISSSEDTSDTYIEEITEITDEIIDEAQNKTNLKYHKQFTIVQDGQSARFQTATYTDLVYYNVVLPLTFVPLETNDTIANLLGTLPTNTDEIVISNYIADNIIKNGIYIKSENDENDVIYKPENYNQIISENKYIKISVLNKYVKIVGIIENDLTEFQQLKNITSDESQTSVDDTFSYNLLLSNLDKYEKVYVTKDFIQSLNLKENNITHKTSTILVDNNYYTAYRLGYIFDELEAFDGNDTVKFKNLENNEIIIDRNVLNDITNNDYQTKLNTNTSSTEEFTKNYIKENTIINRIIKIKNNTTETYEEYIIKGVILEDSLSSIIYYPKDKISNINFNNVSVYSIFTTANNKEDLTKIFNLYPIDKASTLAKTKYSEDLLIKNFSINTIKSTGKYLSIFSLILAILLLTNFINTSIKHCQKDLNTLKSQGCTNKEISKIFLTESLALIVISLLLAYIGINIIINQLHLNNLLSYGYKEIIYLTIITILMIIISNIPLKKIK